MNTSSFIKNHSNFPLNSRLWVYPADRILTEKEQFFVNTNLAQFTQQWAAHGTQLEASSAILYDAFIVLIVNEDIEPASGCSIDTSVKIIKEIGAKLNINFFDRNNVLYLNDNELDFTNLSNLSSLNNEIVFNSSVANFQDFQNKFELPFKESALANVNIDNSFSFSL